MASIFRSALAWALPAVLPIQEQPSGAAASATRTIAATSRLAISPSMLLPSRVKVCHIVCAPTENGATDIFDLMP